VCFRHYLEGLLKKTQAVRQVAPELVAEMPEAYGSWGQLSETHGSRKAARLRASVLVSDGDDKPVVRWLGGGLF
jgi:hypothetical protein